MANKWCTNQKALDALWTSHLVMVEIQSRVQKGGWTPGVCEFVKFCAVHIFKCTFFLFFPLSNCFFLNFFSVVWHPYPDHGEDGESFCVWSPRVDKSCSKLVRGKGLWLFGLLTARAALLLHTNRLFITRVQGALTVRLCWFQALAFCFKALTSHRFGR